MPANPEDWKEAKKRCRLNEEDIRAAKELGFKPKTLIKNIPAKNEQWKAPVKDWIWDLWEEKTGKTRPARKKQAAAPRRNEFLTDDVPF